MSVFNSIRFKYEKYKLEKVFGLKKIVWIIIFVTIGLLIPSYFIGNSIASSFYKKDQNFLEIFESKEIPHPEYTIKEEGALVSENEDVVMYKVVENKTTKNIGYNPWFYTYEVYDLAGNLLQKDKVKSFLLPDEENYIVVPIEKNNRDSAVTMEIKTDLDNSIPIDYNPEYKKYYGKPDIAVSNKAPFGDEIKTMEYLNINFSVKNRDIVEVKEVEVIYKIRNIDKNIIGIGKYILYDFKPEEEREINLKYPNPKLGTTQTLDLTTIQVNYLDIGNITLR